MRDNHLTDDELLLQADGLQADGDHLATCPVCKARLTELEDTMSEVAGLVALAVLPPADAPRAQLRSRLAAEAPARGQGIPIAASLLVACLAVFAIYTGRSADLSTPKNSLTPGETRAVTIQDVCRPSPDESSTVPVSLKRQVFQEYGIHDTRPNAYEVDYLITPELGGASSIRNLWPQPYSAVWNAHVKDRLEDRLHGLVCTGQVDLVTAQREISTDWIRAYKKYFHTDKPF
jgi:hypothetical protein